MVTTYSLNDLAAFLDWASAKGLMKTATAQSRKIAAQKVLGALDESEQEDLRGLDRDAAFARFVNKSGSNFTPDSLATYRSRFQTALDDFLRYRESPASFRFAPSQRSTPKGNGKAGVNRSGDDMPVSARRAAPPPQLPGPAAGSMDFVFPIPIRDGVVVRVHNLPANLTKAEAQRISAVILALAVNEGYSTN